jgi:hypothetical protein
MTTSWGQGRRRLSLEIYKFQETSWPLCWQQLCPSLARDLSTAACFDKTYLPLPNSAPLTSRVWSCSSSYNFVTKLGNFLITHLVSRLITLLYDSYSCCTIDEANRGVVAEAWKRTAPNWEATCSIDR